MLSRMHAVEAAELELLCLATHIGALELLFGKGPLSQCAAGVQQLREAVERITSDIAAARAAKIQ